MGWDLSLSAFFGPAGKAEEEKEDKGTKREGEREGDTDNLRGFPLRPKATILNLPMHNFAAVIVVWRISFFLRRH